MSMTRGASFNPTCCSCSHGHEMPAAYRILPVHAMQCETLTTSLTNSFVFFTTSKQYGERASVQLYVNLGLNVSADLETTRLFCQDS